MLLARLLTAAVALPLLVAVVALGPPWLLNAILGLIGLLGLWEYLVMTGSLGRLTLVAGAGCGLALVGLMGFGRGDLAVLPALAGLALSGLGAVLSFRGRAQTWQVVERLWLGLGLIFLPLGCMAGLAAVTRTGRWLLLFLLGVVFAADTGAYFCGRAWGRKKLSPHVSPGKTWAGLWGGLAGGTLVGLLAGVLDGDPADLVIGPLLGLSLAGLGVLGDLMISLLKRTYQVKDTGSLLPGHGGFLDRLDSFILAGPWLYAAYRLWGV